MSDSTGHGNHKHHILEYWTGTKTFLALLVLTVLTVYTAKYVDLGPGNFPLAMFIATVKAMLVCLWFMGLKFDDNENRTIFFSGVVFLVIFVFFSASDLWFRYVPGMNPEFAKNAVFKPKFKKPWLPSNELVTHGKGLYDAQCASCHGSGGAGDGPAAAALATPPRNFKTGGKWLQGRKPSQVFGTVSKGVNLMPAFGSLNPEDRWALVHYVLSLGPKYPNDTNADYKNLGIDPNAETLAAGGGEKSIPIDLAIEVMAN